MASKLKTIASVVLASGLLLGLTGCEDVITVKFQRTSKTPSVTFIEKSVDLFRTECEDNWVTGEHPSCGGGEIIEVCQRPVNGSITDEECGMNLVYDTCYHNEPICRQVPNGKATAKLKLVFDSRVKLQDGQVEEFKAALKYKDGLFSVRPAVVKSKHKYKFPKELKFPANKVTTLKFELVTKPVKK